MANDLKAQICWFVMPRIRDCLFVSLNPDASAGQRCFQAKRVKNYRGSPIVTLSLTISLLCPGQSGSRSVRKKEMEILNDHIGGLSWLLFPTDLISKSN